MDHLKELIAQDDTVVFVGSGVSRWAGLPSWEGLIEELAVYLAHKGFDPTLVRQEARDGDLLQAASYGLARLTKPQFAEFIRLASRSGTATPAAIHEEIMNLGPSCFITTNYDDLLEQAYRRWRPAPAEPRVVTNRQLTEQADIVHAQARQFIFKPHGDARDSDSIVLAREQYRELYPGGLRNATLETLKTLLPSRPVLYVGFGLRDPDFLYVRDLLANLYRGGTRDHYAIVSDPVPEQIDYWRTNFGVHLVGYETLPRADGRRDHGPLLDLLTAIRGSRHAGAGVARAVDLSDPAVVLELARYAASNLVTQPSERFPIRIMSRARPAASRFGLTDPYHYWTVDRFLLEGPQRAVLIGAPGAGKSFAMQGAVNTLASALQDACLQGQLTEATEVPIGVDLKLYQGDLREQIEARFPPKLSLDQLIGALPVKLFLDGYNELPREYREDGSFDRQLDALLAAQPQLGMVIGSRTPDGLDRLELATVELNEIPIGEVERRLADALASVPAEHRRDIIAVLQRPFYFRLLEDSTDLLNAVRRPVDLYARYIDQVRLQFQARLCSSVDLVEALEHQAYSALEHGVEAFALSELAGALASVAPGRTTEEIEAIMNWLVSVDLLIPSPGGRGAFVHQSITEYLAARALARRLEGADDIAELIALRRWDNAIYLALSMLDGPKADSVLQQMIASDLRFALNGVRYVEAGREAQINKLLWMISREPKSDLNHDFDQGLAFERLPIAPSHEPALREIERKIPSLRGEAIRALGLILGKAYKPELIFMLFDVEETPHLYAMRALAPLLNRDEIRGLVDRALLLDPESLDVDDGDTSRRIDALATALGRLPPAAIREETIARFSDLDQREKRIIAKLVCEIFSDTKSEEGLAMIIEVVRERLPASTFALYLNVRFEENLQSSLIGQFDEALLKTVIAYVEDGDCWAVHLLHTICPLHPDVAKRVLAAAEHTSWDVRRIIEYCATGNESALFAWLESIVGTPCDIGPAIPEIVELSELDWTNYHDLFVSLLARRDMKLAHVLLGPAIPVEIEGLEQISLGPVTPWLDWLLELIDQQNEEHEEGQTAHWVSAQLAFLIARSAHPASKAELLELLDAGKPELRWAIATMVLPDVEGLSIDDLSKQSTTFLEELLRTQNFINAFRPHVFALIATEQFVRDRLLPLAATDNDRLRRNIEAIALAIGKRLGLRFMLPSHPTDVPMTSDAVGN